MKLLVACEESQRVCIAFREKGHEAYSCDIIECSGGHPEWHIKADVLPLLNGNCKFKTMDGVEHEINGKWDMIIAHPPCTYLTVAGNRHFSKRINPPEKIAFREKKRKEAFDFVIKISKAKCKKIVIENPVGYLNTNWKKPTQIIHPYFFAESEYDKENYMEKQNSTLAQVNLKKILHLKCAVKVCISAKKRLTVSIITVLIRKIRSQK